MEIPLSINYNLRARSIDYRIHPLFRLFLFLIALILLASSTLFGAISVPGLAFSALSLLASMYTEHWKFGAMTGSFFFRTGFYPFIKTYEWQTGNAVSISVSVFIKGKFDQGEAKNLLERAESGISRQAFFPFSPEYKIRLHLIIEFQNGETVLVDEKGIREKINLTRLARQISEISGIHYEEFGKTSVFRDAL